VIISLELSHSLLSACDAQTDGRTDALPMAKWRCDMAEMIGVCFDSVCVVYPYQRSPVMRSTFMTLSRTCLLAMA